MDGSADSIRLLNAGLFMSFNVHIHLDDQLAMALERFDTLKSALDERAYMQRVNIIQSTTNIYRIPFVTSKGFSNKKRHCFQCVGVAAGPVDKRMVSNASGPSKYVSNQPIKP